MVTDPIGSGDAPRLGWVGADPVTGEEERRGDMLVRQRVQDRRQPGIDPATEISEP